MTRSLTGDPVTDELVPVAVQLVGAVRDGDPDAVARTLRLAGRIVDGRCEPNAGLAVVLAALVPEDAKPSELLGWWGYHAEYMRLRLDGVDPDAARVITSERARRERGSPDGRAAAR